MCSPNHFSKLPKSSAFVSAVLLNSICLKLDKVYTLKQQILQSNKEIRRENTLNYIWEDFVNWLLGLFLLYLFQRSQQTEIIRNAVRITCGIFLLILFCLSLVEH